MSAVAYAVASPGFPDRTDDQTGEQREAVNIAESRVEDGQRNPECGPHS
jgi:hypothetical protein